MEINEELTQKLITYLDQTTIFVKEQAPDVVQQILSFGAITHTVGIALGATIILIGAILGAVGFVNRDEYYGAHPLLTLVFPLVFSLGLGVVACNYLELRKIEIAPKVFILEKLNNKR